MTKEKRIDSRGTTLVELMVAIVILAIVVMFISILPTQSQKMMLKSDRVSAATAGARDKIETMRSVIARTGPLWPGYANLKALYPDGVTRNDTFKFAEYLVIRRTTCQWLMSHNDDSLGVISLRCIALNAGVLPSDSMDTQVRVQTLVAKRDTLPPF